jgi:hypothetical protein
MTTAATGQRRETGTMAFGQASGPPASHSQMRELTELLQAAGHSDFRDARGPMGFTQRQANGKFTRDEADEFIAALQEAAEGAPDAAPDPAPDSPSDSSPVSARPKPAQRDRSHAQLEKFSDEQLAAELQRRGWVVMEP